jgi:hypothetical protein
MDGNAEAAAMLVDKDADDDAIDAGFRAVFECATKEAVGASKRAETGRRGALEWDKDAADDDKGTGNADGACLADRRVAAG